MSLGTIIYVGGFVLPDKNAAANRVVSNGKIFNSLGYNTVFIGAAESGENFSGIRPVDGCENMFEQAHPKNSSEWLKHMLNVSHIEAIAENYGDVKKIILYNVPALTLFMVKKVFRRKNISVCYDCTEWTKDTDGSFLKKAFKAFDEILIRNFAHKTADGMIVISNTMKSKYKKCSNLVLLPPLVDINDPIWHQQYTKNGKFEFCFAGVPDGNKESLDKAVEAFCSIEEKNCLLRIIGITAEDFERIYPECIISPEKREQIIFMGKLSHNETIKYVLGCDCYIFIRCSDRRNNAGFPTKFAEAFTCNVPVITTDVSDIGEYLRISGKGKLLGNMTAEEIADAMTEQISRNYSDTQKTLSTAFHYESFTEECRKWFAD